MDVSSLLAGLLAYVLSVVASVLLVFGTYRLNTILTRRIDEERLLKEGHRSVAIALGAVVLSQAILLRHAIFPSMVVLRGLFLDRPGLGAGKRPPERVGRVRGRWSRYRLQPGG